MKLERRLFTVLGPGLLMAAAAIGVSHLVQSTRAGALYGMDLLLFILLAFVMKYPTFRFGHEYAHATGQHLLTGFRRQGTWAVLLCAVVIFCVMFTGFAAVVLVTSGLAVISFDLDLPIPVVAAGICVFSGALPGSRTVSMAGQRYKGSAPRPVYLDPGGNGAGRAPD